ncbi:pseudouridine synthase [Chlamydia suis]|uniref:pseudouridine synthase n=1 Tax=Chlamydia suis TaxID=83559 RepID=UPI0003BFF797|nr:pseudouridine synthase [Chlamydia suis]ESN89038.1 pseudouridine synthase [Chlamydia suis MD56]MDD6309893.1 pseudouridine synthase [Chlamydia suis]MDD7386122.1 pseudouridine synthase [Chlamydia suis]MDY4960660.1 pseudouridine synthase [Chlamydia suis]SIU03761.1 ribosomal large subunit pseudouridine synthase B,Ribosomal large subunit pseudouridine synthase B,23S rRNA pseudouridine synthase F,pseudouridine synthase,RNA pseudouridylate synthase [Chlamydia suis]
MAKVRLNKFLASAGVASRRKCDEIIFAGAVTVNGKVAAGPFVIVDEELDSVEVGGQRIGTEKKVYFMVHKPLGYLCSSERKFPGSKLVIDLLSHCPYRLFTVGRLDKETSGLILVTNDGEFSNRVIHPSFGITKEYLLKVSRDVSARDLETLMAGVVIDGRIVRPVSVKKVRRGTIKIIVNEGKKHEIRLFAEAAGLQLLELKRIRIGSLVLGGLPYGQYRELTDAELNSCLSGKGTALVA